MVSSKIVGKKYQNFKISNLKLQKQILKEQHVLEKKFKLSKLLKFRIFTSIISKKDRLGYRVSS